MKKLSLYTSFGRGSLNERMKAIHEAGFDAVCLDFEAEMLKLDGTWHEQVIVAEKYGLPIETVHLTGTDMNEIWSEGEKGEFVTERLITELRSLRDLGIASGVCHVTWGHARPHTPDRIGLDRYLKITEAAEKYNIKLALENSVYPEYLEFIFKNIDSKSIGFCYDSGHENAFSPNFDYLSMFGDRLFAMHLHDNMGGGSDAHAVPFTGTIDWDEKVRKLKKTKLWETVITLESVVCENQTLEEGAAQAYQAAARLAKM